MAGGPEILARVYRGEEIEAVHYGSVVVLDAAGKVTHSVGDPDIKSMTRSSIKPFQALPLLTSGAADEFHFTPRQLAIMCGSHNGSDEHKDVVFSILEQCGCTPEQLRCGTHWPLGMQFREEFPSAGEDKDPLRHNCSGKHAGFLALAKYVGDPLDDYLDPQSKSQTMVRRALSDFCEYPLEGMAMGIDGCSAPNYPLPLRNLALGYRKIANLESDSPSMVQVLARIKGAMTEYPEMVSGEGRFDLDLARSFPRNLICKVGAEAVEAIGMSDPPVGIGVKIHDGNWRALGAVCVAVLKQLHIINDIQDFPYLKRHETPLVRNYRRTVTGRIAADVKLKRA